MQIYSSKKVTGLIKIDVQVFQQKYTEQDCISKKSLSLTNKMHGQHSGAFEGIVRDRRTQELRFQIYGTPSWLPNNVWRHKSQQFPRETDTQNDRYRSLKPGLGWPLQWPGAPVDVLRYPNLAEGPAGPSSPTSLWAVARSQACFYTMSLWLRGGISHIERKAFQLLLFWPAWLYL